MRITGIQAAAAANIRKFYGAEAVPQFAKDAEAKIAEAAKATA